MPTKGDGLSISPELFAEQERVLTAKLKAIEDASAEQAKVVEQRHHLVSQFDRVADTLQKLDIDTLWGADSSTNELIDAVIIHADRMQVRLYGAPEIVVLLIEVGLQERSGTRKWYRTLCVGGGT